jgi:hypothetical protein
MSNVSQKNLFFINNTIFNIYIVIFIFIDKLYTYISKINIYFFHLFLLQVIKYYRE